MPIYTFKSYQKGFEVEQIKIGTEISKNWAWPYAFTPTFINKFCSGVDFDPENRIYCFDGDRIVGYILFRISPKNEKGIVRANLQYPRVLPDHEKVFPLLIEKALDILKNRGVNLVHISVSTMWENSFEIVEQLGFKEHEDYQRGFKLYYVYDLENGPLNTPVDSVKECKTEEEFEHCAKLASNWYNSSIDEIKNHLKEAYTPDFTIAHLYVHENDEAKAACILAPSVIVDTVAAFYYIYSPKEWYLKPMVAKAISICIQKGYKSLLVDLIRKHRKYEDFYANLGFTKEAEHAVYIKLL